MTTTPITDAHEQLSKGAMNRADLAYGLARKFELGNRELREALEKLDAIYRSELDDAPPRPKWLTDVLSNASRQGRKENP